MKVKMLEYPGIESLNSWGSHSLRTQIEPAFQLYNPLQACNLFSLLISGMDEMLYCCSFVGIVICKCLSNDICISILEKSKR